MICNTLTAQDVAFELGISKNLVYRLAREGAIGSFYVGRKLRFTREDVNAYIEKQYVAGARGVVDASSVDDPGVAGSALVEPVASLAGTDVVADLIAHHVTEEGLPVRRSFVNGYAGLVDLYAGKTDAVVIGMFDQRTTSCNTAYVRHLAPGRSVVQLRLAERVYGYVVKEGNPLQMQRWSSIVRRSPRLANRPLGCTERMLLDENLVSLEATVSQVLDYDRVFASEHAAAQAIANGAADVCIGTKKTASLAEGLEFIPLQPVLLDLVMAKRERTTPFIRHVKSLAASPAFRREMDSAGFTATDKSGVIVYEC